MQYSLSPGPQSHFPTPHSSDLAKRLTSSVLPPADQKMKQKKSKERMLAQPFFLPAIFHAETMPLLLKGEVNSTRHSSHSVPYWSQIAHKITCYEKPQNILGHKKFQQVTSLVIFTLHLNNPSQIRKPSMPQTKVHTCMKRDYDYCLQGKKPL